MNIDDEVKKAFSGVVNTSHTEVLIREVKRLDAEVKRLREELVTYADFVFWVDIEHNISFDEYERKVGLK